MKKIGIFLISLFLFLTLAPDTQAQQYVGDCSFPIKFTCEDLEPSENVKFVKETINVTGQIFFPGGACAAEFVLTGDFDKDLEGEETSTICITDINLINTIIATSKTDRFKGVGYGYVEETGDIVILNAKGKFKKDNDGNVKAISILSGNLSGGNTWVDDYYFEDCTWTANFTSKLLP